MRILHVIDSGGLYGAERVVLGLAAGLSRLGHSVVVASIGTPHDAEKPFEHACRERGLDVRLVRMARGPSIRGAMRLCELARSERADVVHVHGYKPDILLGPLPRRFRPAPLVATVHGYASVRGFGRMRWYQRLDALALRRMDRVVLVHRGLTRWPALDRLAHPGWTVIENGLPSPQPGNPSSCLSREVEDFCARGPTIGAVGRLSHEKGFDVLLQATARLLNEGHRIGLAILGEGPKRASLASLAGALGITSSVLLPGYVPEASAHLRLFSMFALPSRTEGLPIVLLEAMHAGVPIAATEVGGVPDVLEHGKAGIIVPPDDAPALASAIGRLLADPALAASLVSNARSIVRSRYSEEAMVTRYEALYREASGVGAGALA